jgi:integrase/recombinase XerD
MFMKRSPEKQKEFSGLNTEPLFNFNIGKIYASIILDIRAIKKDGHYPIKVRVTEEVADKKRKQYYWDCTVVTALEYHKLHSKKPDPYTKKTLSIITVFWENFKDSLTDLVNKEGFSKTRLDQRLAKGSKDSVIEAFDLKIAALEKKGRIGSAVWFTGARNSIKKHIGDQDLKFSEVTPDWLESYQVFLRREEYDKEGKLIVKAKKDTTISIIMRALRAIINEAKSEGIIIEDQYPFGKGKFKIPTPEGRIIALSEDQIKAISQYPINPEAFIYRRLWLFSYYCNGINIGDALRLKYKNIVKEDGKYFIQWEREKTRNTGNKKRAIKALMRPEMQKVIDLHGNPDHRPDSYIFPFLKYGMKPREEREKIQNLIHTINKKMKAIGKALGYGDITTYWARHAFTNNSLNKGVSMFSLSDRLGHATVKTTQIYAGRLSNKQMIEDANVLDAVEI